MHTFLKNLAIIITFINFYGHSLAAASYQQKKRRHKNEFHSPQAKRFKTVDERVASIDILEFLSFSSDFDIEETYERETRQWTDPDRLVLFPLSGDDLPPKCHRSFPFEELPLSKDVKQILSPPIKIEKIKIPGIIPDKKNFLKRIHLLQKNRNNYGDTLQETDW